MGFEWVRADLNLFGMIWVSVWASFNMRPQEVPDQCGTVWFGMAWYGNARQRHARALVQTEMAGEAGMAGMAGMAGIDCHCHGHHNARAWFRIV